MNVVSIEPTESLLPLLNNATFKGGLSLNEHNLFYYVKWSQGKILERLLPERMFLEMFSMGFPRNHQFFETFNEKLEQMTSGGLIDYYTSGYKDQMNPQRYAHLVGSNSDGLKMNRLQSGFVFWFVSTSFVLAGFFLDWLVKLKEYFVRQWMITVFRKKVVKNFNKSVKKRIAKKAFQMKEAKKTSKEPSSVEKSEETPLAALEI